MGTTNKLEPGPVINYTPKSARENVAYLDEKYMRTIAVGIWVAEGGASPATGRLHATGPTVTGETGSATWVTVVDTGSVAKALDVAMRYRLARVDLFQLLEAIGVA
jgi:hypothetical protein